MDLLVAAAKPWTYWIAPVIFLVGTLALLGTLLGYYVKVIAPRHPRQ